MTTGNVAALLSPLVFIPVLTFAFGTQKYDWESMKLIRKGDDTEIIRRSSVADGTPDPEFVPGAHEPSAAQAEADMKRLNKDAKIARSLTVFLTLALLIVWPMPMFGSNYVFSKSFFTGKSHFDISFGCAGC